MLDKKLDFTSACNLKPLSPSDSTALQDTMAGDKTYIDISRAKCEQRDRLIRNEWKISQKLALGNNVLEVPRTCGVLSEREINITEYNDALDIIERIRQQVYTAEEVALAFCKRAAIAQQLVGLNPSVERHD